MGTGDSAGERMKNKVVAFDLDDTLIGWDTPYWEVVGSYLGIKLEPPNGWMYPNYPAKAAKAIQQLFLSDWYMIKYPKPKEGANDVIDYLKYFDYSVLVITARDMTMYRETAHMMYKHFPNVDFFDCVGRGMSKLETLKHHKVDYWVDDNPNQCIETADNGIKTILINQPWNQEVKQDRFLIRVNDLKEAKHLIFKKGFNAYK